MTGAKRRNNPEVVRRAHKKYRESERGRRHLRRREFARSLRRYFKLSVEDYARMVHAQDMKCGICMCTLQLDAPHFVCVDHGHISGAIRGLLCVNCNLGMGHFFDDAGRLIRALEYLLKKGT